MSFKITAEAFVSSKFNREHTAQTESGPILYINTQLGSKYTNQHTGVSSYDNMRILLKGKVADAWKEQIKPRDLVRVEGTLHEKSYTNEAGVKTYYMEATIHSFRKLELRKKAEAPTQEQQAAPQAEVTPQAPTQALPDNVLQAIANSLTPEQLAAMMQNA